MSASTKLPKIGIFERSFRAIRKRAIRDDRSTLAVLMRIRRAALVAEIKHTQKKEAK